MYVPGVHVPTRFRPVLWICGEEPNGEKCQRKLRLFISLFSVNSKVLREFDKD